MTQYDAILNLILNDLDAVNSNLIALIIAIGILTGIIIIKIFLEFLKNV